MLLLALAAASLLVCASRAPFFAQHVDWGVFDMEHLWFMRDSGAVARMNSVPGASGYTLTDLEPYLFGGHFHAGTRVVTDAVRLVGSVTGTWSLREVKVVGLLATLCALWAWLATIVRVWPDARLRWAVGVYVAWLAPPTLMLWMTLIPMGQYMETWVFHALLSPALLHILGGRASVPALFATGLGAGVAAVYVFSNVLLVALLLTMHLLFSEGSRRRLLAGVTALLVGAGTVWLPFAWSRLEGIKWRLEQAGVGEPRGGGLLGRIAANVRGLVSPEVLALGDDYSYRGLLALLEPPAAASSMTASFVLAAATLAGAVYLLAHALRLLRASTRTHMDLPSRLLAANGVLLVASVLAYCVLLDGPESPLRRQRYVSYLTLVYPPLLFGLAMGAASLLERWTGWRRGIAGAGVLALFVLLGAGWAQSSAWNVRAIDRPSVPPGDHKGITRPLNMLVGSSTSAGEIASACDHMFPDNEAFCSAAAWDLAIESGFAGPGVSASACASLPEAERDACAVAVGRKRYLMLEVPGLEPGKDGIERVCGVDGSHASQACATGGYRTRGKDPYDAPYWSAMTLLLLCQVREGTSPLWAQRACLEASGWMVSGMPLLPSATDGAAPGACSLWPGHWRGLCARLGTVRQARDGERSCEDVYRERFLPDLPVRNSLMYQQCAFMDLVPRFPAVPTAVDEAGGDSFLPACVIGVARALEGVECSWSGSELLLGLYDDRQRRGSQ